MNSKLASEKVVISAPMSFHGSAARTWKITNTANPYVKWLVLVPLAIILISIVWFLVMCWYLIFGLLLVPYRLIRRSSRKNKREQLRHREVLEAVRKRSDITQG